MWSYLYCKLLLSLLRLYRLCTVYFYLYLSNFLLFHLPHLYFTVSHSHVRINNCNFDFLFIAPTWYPLPLGKSLGKLPNIPGIKTYPLPPTVPADAKKVLLFVTSHSKYNPGHNRAARYRLFTKEGGYKFSKYMTVFFFAHLHTTSNSQNIWLPVTSDRLVRASYFGPIAKRHLFGKVYLIGYIA